LGRSTEQDDTAAPTQAECDAGKRPDPKESSMPDAPVTERTAAVEAAARRLADAAARGEPCEPVRDVLGTTDIDLAYAVQRTLTAQRLAAGARVVGRKIGITSEAVQRQVGVTTPDFGVLFDDMLVAETASIPSGRLIQPRAEAEIAFILAADLVDGPLDVVSVRAATAYAVAALEIVDSRIRGWDITITDTVADNASSGLFVLGSRQIPLADFEPADVVMTLQRDGTVASTGNGGACLGDPLAALSWLAHTARDFGAPLRAGDVVLSGALGPLVDVGPGVEVLAELSVLGRVTATFSTEEQ
jgi:2-keto-4-pentenoate hydratase